MKNLLTSLERDMDYYGLESPVGAHVSYSHSWPGIGFKD